MEGLNARFEHFKKSLTRLHEALDCYEKNIDHEDLAIRRLIRDGLLQNYEFTIETLWKFLHAYLQEIYRANLESMSALKTLKEAQRLGVISADEYNQVTQLIADRNETSHAYFELLAIEIVQRIPAHYAFMKTLLNRIQAKGEL